MGSPHHQYMILSLPNSGTDWLCRILAKHGRSDGLRYYDKEFFNPICNPKYATVLEARLAASWLHALRTSAFDQNTKPTTLKPPIGHRGRSRLTISTRKTSRR